MLRVCTLLSAAPVRFPHWKGHIRKGAKLSLNPHLNLKTRKPKEKTHDFIDFRTLTGNEILYNMQNAEHFRPYEYSNSFLTLGLKKGAPANYSWESNSFIQTALQQGKAKLPQYNCKVLTSLAHAWCRLGIKDPELWKLLETHIVRQFSTIEPKGLARAMWAFTKVEAEQFWAKVDEMLPVYLRKTSSSDLVLVILALCERQDNQNPEMFEKYIYPYLKARRFQCTPAMLERLKEALKDRKDFDEERKALLDEAIVQRYENLKRLKFGGLRVPHEAQPPAAPESKEKKPETPAASESKEQKPETPAPQPKA